jgi:hypothetical protein
MSIKKPDQSPKISRQDMELTDKELDHAAGGAQADRFLKLDGIDGESKDDKHKDSIQIESFSTSKPKP